MNEREKERRGLVIAVNLFNVHCEAEVLSDSALTFPVSCGEKSGM